MSDFLNNQNEFSNFETWHEQHKHMFSKKMNEVLSESAATLGFIFFWKKYEQLLVPKFYKLLELQFPLLVNADKGFAEKINQNITHRIFEFAEDVWRIVISNQKGLHPQEVIPITYNLALTSKVYDPAYVNLYNQHNIPDFLKERDEDAKNRFIAEANEDILKRSAWLIQFNKQVIEVLQTDALLLLPELLNIEAEWWKCYKFYIEQQCNFWRERNERIRFMMERKLRMHK